MSSMFIDSIELENQSVPSNMHGLVVAKQCDSPPKHSIFYFVPGMFTYMDPLLAV